MAEVSLGRAIGSGFALIRHRPASVLVWGLLLVVFVQAPALYMLSQVGPQMLGLWGATGPTDPAEAQNIAFAFQGRMALIQALTLPAWLIRAVIVAAVYRAVLEPQKRGLAYLRIGRQEGWLLLLMLTAGLLTAFAIIPIELIVVVAVVTGIALKGLWWLLGPAVGIAGLVALLWAFARLSMAAPMTFADRNFRLFESWRMTQRHGFSLLGLGLLTVLLMLALELLLFGAIGVVAAVAIAGRQVDAASIQAWLQGLTFQSPGQLAAWLVPTGLVAAAVFGALNAIAIAPWASAYQQLNTAPGARA
jgi:hypothetical protein